MSGINNELLEALESLVLFSKPTKTNSAALSNAYSVIEKARGHITLPVTQSAIDAASQEEEEK